MERVETVLDRLRPGLQFDGGDVELLNVEDGVVFLHLVGACAGCAMSSMTLKLGIERSILQEIPGIRAVESV
ncbi:MAG: NifU family protein [Symbiobacteriia bacterium]